jgi:predicted MPP superfamily phosphohydrolase
MTIRITHVSDLHFHKNNSDNAQADALLNSIAERYSFLKDETNYLLVTGDIVDDGDDRQYSHARSMLERFEGGILLCPGNHCYGPYGNVYRAECADRFDQLVLELKINTEPNRSYKNQDISVKVLSDGKGVDILTIGLNSILDTDSVLDFAKGGIGIKQLNDLDMVLSNPEYIPMKKLIYLHHRPQKCTWYLELTDSEDLMAVLNNRADIVCFGHSGGSMSVTEPEQTQAMLAKKKRFGVPFLLNAASSVKMEMFYEIVVDGSYMSVETKTI